MTASHWAKKKKAGIPLKERDRNDFYPTPASHVRLALARYAELSPKWVLDIGAGAGIWGEVARECWQDAQIVGSEYRMNVSPHSAYNRWISGDFLALEGGRPAFDIIMANPPYKLSEPIIRKAFSLLMPGGFMVMLFRLQFLASIGRYPFWSEEFPPYEVMVCSDRPSFSGDGNTDSDDYMLVHWMKLDSGSYAGGTSLTWGIADERKRIRQRSLF